MACRSQWGGVEERFSLFLSLAVAVDLPARGDREDLTWLWHRCTTVSLSLIVNFTRLSDSDLYSWQWQLMAAIPIPLRSQRIVLAVLGIGRSLYDMEMNAMQAIYSDGGTFIDASTTSAPSICHQFSPMSARSFHRDTTTSKNRTTYCTETSDCLAYSQHLLFHRLTWRFHMIGGGFTWWLTYWCIFSYFHRQPKICVNLTRLWCFDLQIDAGRELTQTTTLYMLGVEHIFGILLL